MSAIEPYGWQVYCIVYINLLLYPYVFCFSASNLFTFALLRKPRYVFRIMTGKLILLKLKGSGNI